MFLILLIVIAVSLDCLGTGLAYGLQNIIIKKTAIGLIALTSGAMFAVAMGLGKVIEGFVAAEMVNAAGAVIVMCLGVYALIRASVIAVKRDKMLLNISVGRLGIIVKILNDAKEADLDRSGIISNKEAFYLAVSLSFDAFAVGIGAALMELDWLISSIAVGIGAAGSLLIGLYLGRKMGGRVGYDRLKVLPGVLLIAVGVFRLLQDR